MTDGETRPNTSRTPCLLRKETDQHAHQDILYPLIRGEISATQTPKAGLVVRP